MSHIAPTPESHCTRSTPCVLCRIPAPCIRCGGTLIRIEPTHVAMYGGSDISDARTAEGIKEGIVHDTSSTQELLVEYDIMSQYTTTENDTIINAPSTHPDPFAEASATRVQDVTGSEVQSLPLLPAYFAIPEAESRHQCHCDSTTIRQARATPRRCWFF
ncbi:hypothetical protein CERSUDRAFT_112896 [Gelatoporia subvermispora B]|uniref:Uncharacterized protein n=1 Tax=Ceriporiopsis subvermispora (strain B) TaxID=914234 RepID=M2RK77_CERS8|nr:hypothetical protein CERSUDRAFT_112896 [Gelatoporia subvermispora B]